MKTMAKLSFVIVVISVILLVFGGISIAQDEMMGQHVPMHVFADQTEIDDTEAVLHRMEHGIQLTIHTVGLTEGNVVTAWWVIFNAPENCSDMACGENDIFNMDDDGEFILNDDGSNPMNMDGIGASQVSVGRVGGLVVDVGGAAWYQGHLPIGDTTEFGFGPGLVNPATAEIHIVLRDHGPAQPGMIDEMMNTSLGGCSTVWPWEGCIDVQFAIFMPPEDM